MTTWMLWRAGAVVATVVAVVGLTIFISRAPLVADSGCLTTTPTPTAVADEAADDRSTSAPSVTMGLSVLAAGDVFPQLVRTITVESPVGDGQEVSSGDPEAASVADLLAMSPADAKETPNVSLLARNRYRQTLESLLHTGPSGVFDELTAGTMLLNVTNLPTIALDEGRAAVTISLPENAFITSYSGVPGSKDFVASPWQASYDGRDITLQATGWLRPGATWRVGVCVEGIQLLSTSPQPDATDGRQHVFWSRSAPTPTAYAEAALEPTSVALRLRPEPVTAFRLRLFSGAGRVVMLAWVYVVPAVLLVVGLRLLPRATASPALDRARARLAVTTLAVLRLAVAGVLALFVAARAGGTSNPGDPVALLAIANAAAGLTLLNVLWLQPATRRRSLTWLTPGLALIAAMVWTFGFADLTRGFAVLPDLGTGAAWEALVRLLLVVGYAGLPAAAAGLWPEPKRRSGRLGLRLALATNLILGFAIGTPVWPDLAGLIPFWVTANFAVGVAMLAGALLPLNVAKRLPAVVRRVGWLFVTALIVLLLVAQWGWATYQSQSIWWRAPVAQDPSRYLPELAAFLRGVPLSYPIAFLGPASALLPLLGLAGLVGALHAVGAHDRSPFWRGDERWVGWVVGFLVAVFVVGYGGEVFGVRLPLALLFSLVLLRLAQSDRIARAAAWVERENPSAAGSPAPLLVTRRRELLNRAQALDRVEEQRAKAFDAYKAATSDADVKPDDPNYKATYGAYYDEVEALDADAARLRRGDRSTGGPNVDALLLPTGFGPGELALGLGPRSRWWNRGLIAARLGGWLALLPLAYFVYVLVAGQSQYLFAVPVPFAGLGLLTALANEAAFWLVAAVAYGCLFPYLRGRNGLVKGAVLGSVYFVAHALASLVGAVGDSYWQVRSVQLLLFLMLLGVLLDAQTVEGAALPWRYLLGRYQVQEAKAALAYATPLIGLLVLLGQQIATGETARAVTAVAAQHQQIGTMLSQVITLLL